LAWRRPPRFSRCRGGYPPGGKDRCDPTEPGEGRFGLDSFGILAGDDKHLGGDVGADAERSDKIRNQLGGQFGQHIFVDFDLGVQG
jgi:hypothetical protein